MFGDTLLGQRPRWQRAGGSATPPLVDGLWFPRYDVDEEALLEAEEADLIFARDSCAGRRRGVHRGEGEAPRGEEDDAQRAERRGGES